MIPDENRSKLDRFQRKPEKLRRSMAVAGQLTAWSHVAVPGSNLSDARSLAAWAESSGARCRAACAVRFSGITCRDFQAFLQRMPIINCDDFRSVLVRSRRCVEIPF